MMICLICITICSVYADLTAFRYDLKGSDEICFEEILPETVGVIIEVVSGTVLSFLLDFF